MVAVLGGGRGEYLRVRAALRLGHREAGDDSVVQQRFEVTPLEFGSAVMSQDLAVTGIRCLGTENDRSTFGPAEDLVEQRKFDLTVARAAQMRSQVGRPQPTLHDNLLQRRNQRLAYRIVEVVRLFDDQVDRFALRAYEVVNPSK